MGVARVSSLPLEAVLGTAGRRRAGVIPTAGAGRRSQRWLRGAPAQAKEGQEPRIAKLTPSSFGLEKRVSEGPGIGGKGPEGATSLHPGGCVCSSLGPPLAYIFPVPPRVQGRRQRAGDCGTVPGAGREPAELGEEPPRPRAEHAAPACSARVHPARRGGDRAEAVASGRCLGPDPLHVSLAWGHVHRLSPVRRPDVLRINKMKLEATGGQIAPVLRTTIPNRATSPLHRSPTAAPPPGRSPPSKLQPRRAPARPRPLAGPGALCRSH
ncbi:uncharacterized protein [Equus przewalskii]|uniref:Uncharacterized protein isoform X1 n=1 Tax=Equus przewalskii TaxID=9798 RepID=A0ABM4KG50_EQUPR